MKLIRHGIRRWVYVLPIFHLCACFSIFLAYLIPYFGILWTYLLLLDLPVSIVAYGLGWKYPSIATIWIVIVGTLWWYLLGRGTQFVFDRFIDRGPPKQPLIPRND